MLKLLCGPSSAGKTTRITQMIKQDIERGIRCFLLVPEQQAYISELDLPARLPRQSGRYFEIVNFSRLADDVFGEYGGIVRGEINAGIRALLMWDTLRELSCVLRQYGKGMRSDMTLTQMMLSTVDELRMAGIDADMLISACEKLEDNEPLQKKLSDIAAIYELFYSKTREAFGNDPTDKLSKMAQTLDSHDYFAGCHIYIDSFTSFTAQEYAVLLRILKQADEVTVALCMDDLHSTLPQFESVRETARRLGKLADRASVEVDRVILPPSTTKKPKTLQILDRDLWRFEIKPEELAQPPIGERDVIRMSVCNNVYEEAEFAALHILELIDGGMHYGDLAIIVRDVEAYRGVLDAAMERHGIPFFLSDRTDLSSLPLSRLILFALRAVDHHYRTQDVIALLKTGLCGIDLRDAALFEEYCETWHISGSRFSEELWSMNPDGLTTERTPRAQEILDAANRVRATLIKPLQKLAASLRASDLLPDRCRAVYNYLCDLNVSALLSERAKRELLENRRREAGESLRLYRFVQETLVSMSTFLPDAQMSVEEFTAALSLIFASTDLGSVPNVHDCVTIGSANTVRVENVRAALVLGLCEGEFPQALSDDGILCEGDKEALEKIDIILDSNSKARSSEELLYVYRAMTKPRERLFLSTVANQTDGSARTPSLAFTRVQYLFDITPEEPDLAAVKELLSSTAAHTEPAAYVAPTQSGITLRLSQSKINTFLKCPYCYYSTYTLGLRGPKDSNPSYADDGTFLHYILEHFLRAALQADGTLVLPEFKEIEPIANEIISNYLSEFLPFPPEAILGRTLHLFSRLRKSAVRMLEAIVGELRVSRFVPSKFEQSISSRGEDSVPPFQIDLSDGSRVMLSGKIDRIDLLREGNVTYVRVVDYKSGTHKFSLKDVKTGTEIQLVLYLFSAIAADPTSLRPAGAQYLFPTTEKGHTDVKRSGFLLSEDGIPEAADATEDKLYTKSLESYSAEELCAMAQDMIDAVTAVSQRILAGEAQKTPSKEACKFCPVKASCDRAYHE